MALDTKTANVDMETGEVLEEETVVDFRKVKGEYLWQIQRKQKDCTLVWLTRM